MKKLLALILFLSLSFTREHIAVIDFEGINVSEVEAKALTQKLTTELIKVGEYIVLERSEMKKVLDEQKFQYSGCVDTKCAVEIGMMLGAKYIVVGSVSKVGSTYSIDSRLINVKTGESYQSAEFNHKGEIDYLLLEGMKSVAYQLCTIEVKSILPAQVEAIRTLAIKEGFNDKELNLYLNQNYNCSINKLTHQQAIELINYFQSENPPKALVIYDNVLTESDNKINYQSLKIISATGLVKQDIFSDTDSWLEVKFRKKNKKILYTIISII